MTATLMAAGSGGHLMQLKLLCSTGVIPADEITWVTDRTPQSESLLAGERVTYLPHRAPRDVIGVLKNAWSARLIVNKRVKRIYSTGAGIAISLYLPALIKGVPMTYIESATRTSRLSLTGRVINFLPFVERRVQHKQLANRRWSFEGSVFDNFVGARTTTHARPVKSIFVSLGANQHVGFRSLIERILLITPPGVNVYFQYGPTEVSDLQVEGSATMTWQEVRNRSMAADAVITHAGTGSILTTLLAGKIPIVIPRSGATGEHVDEHQSDLAAYAGSMGLAIAVTAEQLEWSHVLEAAGTELRRMRVPDGVE